jgi:O-antigen/teichoic acid export membrane protein
MKTLGGGALLALASAGEALGAFVVGVLVARDGGPLALGRFATTMALLLAAVTLTELGQNVVLTRRTASGDPAARSRLGASLLLKAAASLLLLPLAFALWPRDEPSWGALAAGCLVLLSSLTISATAALRGRLRFGSVASAAAIAAVLGVLGVVWLRPATLAGLLALLAVAQLAKAAVAVAALPERPAWPRGPDLRALIRETLPFAALVCLGVAYLKADVLLLAVLAGPSETGRYAAAARLTEALKLAPTALASALLPALASGRPRELAQGVAAALAVGAGAVLLSQWIGEAALAALFGASFAASAEALRLLSVAFAFASLNAVLIAQLYAWGLEARAALALACALAANVALNLALAPSGGAVGSARAALCSEAVLLGFYVLLLRRGACSRASGAGNDRAVERLALTEEPAS